MRRKIGIKTTAQIDEALIAFGLATTETEVDPDRRWEAIKFVSEFLGSLRLASLGQPQSPPTRDDVAKIIYDAFPFEPRLNEALKPEWVPGGNSFIQDKARRAADAILALTRPNRGGNND